MTNGENIKTTAIRSAKWAFLPGFISRFSQPLVNVILAWFLAPEDYGIVAMAALVTGLAGVFRGMGLSQALVHREDDVDRAASVALFLTLAFGMLAYAAIYAMAPVIAGFFKETRVTDVLRVQGLVLVLSAPGSVQIALLQRRFQFKRLFWITLIPALAPACIALPLAAAGCGYWALVWSFLAGTALQTGALWIWSQWRPSLAFDLKLALALLGFGGFVALETLATGTINSVERLIAGRFLGVGNLGCYVMGLNVAMLAIGIWIRPFSALAYSGFCRLRSDPDELKHAYVRMLQITATGVIPLAVGINIVAGPLVTRVLGSKWEGIVPVVRILAVMPGLTWIMAFKSDVYRALGRPDIMPRILLAQLACAVPVYLITARHGLVAFAWGRFAMELLFIAPHIIITMALLKLPGDYFWRSVRSPLIASVAMGCVLHGLLFLLGRPAGAVAAWAGLVGTIASGIAVYAAVLTLLDRALSRRLLHLAGTLIQARTAS